MSSLVIYCTTFIDFLLFHGEFKHYIVTYLSVEFVVYEKEIIAYLSY